MMIELQPFKGSTLCSETVFLGEGPSYDETTDTVWWLNILGKELHELQLGSSKKTVHPLPMMASVIARIDDKRQMLATENGIYSRDRQSGELTLIVAIEADRADIRSNDGRVHPSGALWVGMMSKTAETGVGSIYHVAGSTVTRILPEVSIPNGICFSADGATGYYVDSKVNHYMKVALDPATGLPVGKPELFIDQSGEAGDIDGSVMDNKGNIWNARWRGACVQKISPDGVVLARYAVPMQQVTCPAFIGAKADRLLLTSCWEHLDDAARAADPAAGTTIELGIAVDGHFEPAFRL